MCSIPQGQNLSFLLQLPAGLSEITILVAQQNFWDPATDFAHVIVKIVVASWVTI
jgi:hypothetical protein